ncbi:MAG: hypothetical protein ACI3W7_09285 [Oscillospiraceae bacterium]
MAKKIPIPRGFKTAAGQYSIRQLAIRYHVSTETVRRWMQEAGVEKTGKAVKAWTPEEDEQLRKLVMDDGLYISEAAPLLGRTTDAAEARARRLGLWCQRYRNWSEEEERELRQLAEAGETVRSAARLLGRTENAVRQMACKLCVRFRRPTRAEEEREEYREREEDTSPAAASGTLCWQCENAVPDPERGKGCPWSKSGKPVDGWDAIRTSKAVDGESYFVRACPSFEPDKPREEARLSYEAYRRLMEEL